MQVVISEGNVSVEVQQGEVVARSVPEVVEGTLIVGQDHLVDGEHVVLPVLLQDAPRVVPYKSCKNEPLAYAITEKVPILVS